MLKQTLDNLTSEQLQELRTAFVNETAHHIVLPDGKHFIGVNIVNDSNLNIEETQDVWSYGSIRDGNQRVD
jgi:ribosomal protein S13